MEIVEKSREAAYYDSREAACHDSPGRSAAEPWVGGERQQEALKGRATFGINNVEREFILCPNLWQMY